MHDTLHNKSKIHMYQGYNTYMYIYQDHCKVKKWLACEIHNTRNIRSHQIYLKYDMIHTHSSLGTSLVTPSWNSEAWENIKYSKPHFNIKTHLSLNTEWSKHFWQKGRDLKHEQGIFFDTYKSGSLAWWNRINKILWLASKCVTLIVFPDTCMNSEIITV